MRYVLLGGGGLLGSGVRAVLDARRSPYVRLTPPWDDPAGLTAHLGRELGAHLAQEGPTTLLWAAGVGHVGASAQAMATETTALEVLCQAVLGLPARRRTELSILFASSAGALYAGHGTALIDADAVPRPVSAYGVAKLAQEEMLGRTAQAAGCRLLVARISNLYGLADGVLTARGLVSTAVRATRLRQPMTVFVRSDTRRDYIFNRDAAALALQQLEGAQDGRTTTLVCEGTTRTVSEVLAVVGAVSGRRVPATFAERPETRLQPYVLRFVAAGGGADGRRRTPMQAAVHVMTRAPMAP